MAKIEQIEFNRFPIWEQQSEESEDSFNLFRLFFLPQVRPDLTNAYRRYCESLGDVKGRSKIASKEPPQNWRVSCERNRWRERHRAYYRKIAQDNLEWQQERLRELQEVELILSKRLLERATDILNLPTNPNNDRLKDATALIRTASDVSRKALGQDNLNAAFALLIRNGFEVTDPSLLMIESGENLDKNNG